MVQHGVGDAVSSSDRVPRLLGQNQLLVYEGLVGGVRPGPCGGDDCFSCQPELCLQPPDLRKELVNGVSQQTCQLGSPEAAGGVRKGEVRLLEEAVLSLVQSSASLVFWLTAEHHSNHLASFTSHVTCRACLTTSHSSSK